MTSNSHGLDKEWINEALEFKGLTLYWRVRPAKHFTEEIRCRQFNTRFAGRLAGTDVNGYYTINTVGMRMAVHRLVFFMNHGYLPERVDHINGDTKDNRIENLRAATHMQNIMNMRTPKSNTSGIKGVSWSRENCRWLASIRSNGKAINLGLFDDIEDAAKCRKAAEIRLFGEFSNDR